MTRGQLLDLGVNVLGAKDTSYLSAEVLLCYVLGETKEYLFAHASDEVGDENLEKLYIQYLDRVKKGEPIAYITGEKEFYGLDFLVNKHVLVPRPETEMLVEKALSFMRDNFEKHGKYRVLDVGTGSGNIAISIAKNSAHLDGSEMIEYVDAIDISDEALEVANENVLQHGLEDKVKVFNSNLLEDIDEDEHYHIVVANLPYIGEVTNNLVDKNVKDFEPNSALFAGDDGLKLYKKLFQQIVEREMNWKMLIGEFGFGQREDLEKLLNKYFEQKWSIEKDLAGIDRMFVVFN
jgi:release factor glutamine methyltransferase